MKFPVEKMCKAFKISTSSYYKWLSSIKTKQFKTDELDLKIKSEFDVSRKTYGSPRIALELRKQGLEVSKTTIARRMKSMKIKARSKRRYVTTTQSNHNFPIAENILSRNFDVQKLATVWVSDITYIQIHDVWVYLTTIIDLADRMVIGWSLSSDMTAKNTVIKAFNIAVKNRLPDPGLLFHSDRGIQYACNDFRTLICQWKCVQSMSRKGNCWDNAVAESFFKTIKIECLYRHRFTSFNQVYSVIFDYIDGWYNTVRIHSSLSGLSPLDVFILKSSDINVA